VIHVRFRDMVPGVVPRVRDDHLDIHESVRSESPGRVIYADVHQIVVT
jgi:hypothetical protein